jgi:hypothetical protein
MSANVARRHNDAVNSQLINKRAFLHQLTGLNAAAVGPVFVDSYRDAMRIFGIEDTERG